MQAWSQFRVVLSSSRRKLLISHMSRRTILHRTAGIAASLSIGAFGAAFGYQSSPSPLRAFYA
eukprot:scaffold674954_cov61-Prasinocladus_malaysianus.AAC.1